MEKKLSDLIDAVKMAYVEGGVVYETLNLGKNWGDVLKAETGTSWTSVFMGLSLVIIPEDIIEPDSAFMVSEAAYGRLVKALDFSCRKVRAAEALLSSGKVFVDPPVAEAGWRYTAGLTFQDAETQEAVLRAVLDRSEYSGSLKLRDEVTLRAHDGDVVVIATSRPKECGDDDGWSLCEWLESTYGMETRCVSINLKIEQLRAGLQRLTELERRITQRRSK